MAVKTVKRKTAKTVIEETPNNKPGYFVGIDLHKVFMQVAVMDSAGRVLRNDRIECSRKTVKKEFSKIPANARYVLESSSVWYGMYRFLTDDLNLDVMLSNPLTTRLIAQSTKKTDKVDAVALADLLRGGYLAGCYVPEEMTVEERQLVRYRDRVVRERTKRKNLVHSILLQNGTKIAGKPFSAGFMAELHKIDDWRIEKHIDAIRFLNGDVEDCDARINDAMAANHHAKILTTIPGIGNITALALASEIGDISRFSSAGQLASYFGLVPSVRNSASMVHHGRITKAGNSLVRHLLTEAVLVHTSFARSSNTSTPVSRFYERLARKRGTSKARVAAAAKMLTIIFWMLKKDINFWTCVAEGEKSTHRDSGKGSYSQRVKDHG